jgi:heptosyltransferase-3
VDLCGQLDWRSFSQLLACAQLLIGVDTAAVHVAAAMGTPCVVVTTGMSDPAQWRPLGERASVLVNAVPCLPCFQKHGCESMACIRGLGVHTVLEAARRHMRVTA